MSKTAKVLLALAILCLVLGGAFNVGLINPRGLDALYTIFPIGAVFFGMFLIVLVLQRESDEDPEDSRLGVPGSDSSVQNVQHSHK